MKTKTIIASIASLIILLIITQTVTAVRFDVEQAMQEEWDRYERYKQDYIEHYDLETYEEYIAEYNLMNNFGFYGPEYYYIPQEVWDAKYNPPLQGEAYVTSTRIGTSLTNQPSAVKFYAYEDDDGVKYGYVGSTLSNSIYFDHPDAYNTYSYYSSYYQSSTPVYYARIAEPLGNGYYVVGFY